jgi:acetyltransferase EpsM
MSSVEPADEGQGTLSVLTFGVLGAGGQAIETAGYLQEAGCAVAFFFEERPPDLPRMESAYPAPIISDRDTARRTAHDRVITAVGDPSVRRHLVDVWAEGRIGTLVSDHAWVSRSATIGIGCTLAPLAAVNASARIGDHVLVNTAAVVSHGAIVEDFATLGPGCRIGGGAHIGRDVYIGIGATIIDHVNVGDGAFVAAGAVVVGDVEAHTRVMGVPARRAGASVAPS